MGIVVIIAVFLTPQFLGFFYQSQLEGDVSKITAVLRGARDKSITQEDGFGWGVHFVNSGGAGGHYILFKGGSYPGVDVSRINLNSNINFSSIPSGSSTDVIFSKMFGLPSGVNSLIISVISRPDLFSIINITSSGEIQY